MSPQLQQSAQRLRSEQDRRKQSRQAVEAVVEQAAEPSDYNVAVARALFESKCAQCHGLDTVDSAPPGSEAAAREMVSAMVDEGLEATGEEISQIVRYLTETYARSME